MARPLATKSTRSADRVVMFAPGLAVTLLLDAAARFEGLDADPETRALVAATTASELCQRLIAEGVTGFHFYTLNQAPLSLAVCRMLGLRPLLQEAA
ncbi:MAG: methylenetetrahydrofolate reductase [Proteobacteria bacterium]|nr:methylenetetrahydrofolate reductase [Pseudomonadota bacterium]